MKTLYRNTLLLFFPLFFLQSCNIKGSETVKIQPNPEIQKDTIVQPKPVIAENQHQTDTLTINAVGDVMFGSNFPTASGLPEDMGKNMFKPFETYLKKGDINFANLEGVFLNSGGTPKGSGNNVYCFRQPEEMAKNYTDYGFNLLSIANNHVADFGQEGIENTDRVLRALNLHFAGSLRQPTTSLTVKGIKVGFAAFAPHNGSVNMNDLEAAEESVRQLKKENQIVIVSFHGGAEGSKYQHVTRKKEVFYNQNRGNVYLFAHKMIDAGADVIIGHGPHVLRAVELYKDKFIAYSLGNFATYGQFNLKYPNNLAPMLELKIDDNGNFLEGKIIGGKQVGEGGPILDDTNEAFYKIKELSNEDFPESKLKFENGRILKNQ